MSVPTPVLAVFASRSSDTFRVPGPRLAVGGLPGGAGGEVAERLGAVGHLDGEDDRLRLAGGEVEGQLPWAVDEPAAVRIGAGVGERELHGAREPPGGGVADFDWDLHDVPLAEKPGHDRLDHQVFCRHACIHDRSAAERRVVGEALELPGRERVGQRELDRHDAVLVTRKRWQKERRLDEVLPRRRRGGCGRDRRAAGALRIARLTLLELFSLPRFVRCSVRGHFPHRSRGSHRRCRWSGIHGRARRE
jgi:hypothetical protein